MPTDTNLDRNFFSDKKQSVTLAEGNNINGVFSGVPQGVVLAPFLFNFYVNDMPSLVKSKSQTVCRYTTLQNNPHYTHITGRYELTRPVL